MAEAEGWLTRTKRDEDDDDVRTMREDCEGSDDGRSWLRKVVN